MGRCNCLCTKDATGTCALCEALAERERFIRVWLFGWLIVRLGDQHRALMRWLYPLPQTHVGHQDVVREAHKQYSATLNKTMLTLLGVALVCLLITLSAPDTLLLAASSTVKIPLTDALMSFVAFLVVV